MIDGRDGARRLADCLYMCISRQKEFGSEEDVSDKRMKYDTLEALSSLTISLRRTLYFIQL